jgi:hypothetical protein
MRTATPFVLLVFALAPAPAGFAADAASKGSADKLENAPLAEARHRLLELACRGASAYPTVPHVKNRARAKETVVQAALDLGQRRTAMGWARGITNWREGSNLAEIARHAADRGREHIADRLIEEAKEVAGAAGLETWRCDQIRVKIAQAQHALGRGQLAHGYAADVTRENRGRLQRWRAGRADTAPKKHAARLRKLGNAEGVTARENALQGYARLYARVVADPDIRTRLQKRMKQLEKKLQPFQRVEHRIALASALLEAAHPERARAAIEEGRSILDKARWRLDRAIRYRCRLAELDHDAGSTDEAKRIARDQRALFQNKHKELDSMYRARALRPVAELFAHVGLTSRSHESYERVVALGVVNPNIRPRVTDFVNTCCSMAVHDVTPDDALWTRLQQIQEQLGPNGSGRTKESDGS